MTWNKKTRPIFQPATTHIKIHTYNLNMYINAIQAYKQRGAFPLHPPLQSLLIGDISSLLGCINADVITAMQADIIFSYISTNLPANIYGSKQAVIDWIKQH